MRFFLKKKKSNYNIWKKKIHREETNGITLWLLHYLRLPPLQPPPASSLAAMLWLFLAAHQALN